MASSKTLFGEDPLDRRHRTGGLAEPCQQCGARPRYGENRCWFCESKLLPLAGFEPVTGKEAADPLVASHPPRSGLQFSIGTMLLVTTLVAICLAISLAVPLLGIPLCVIAVGGLVRTAIVGSARIRAGGRFELADKIDEFVVSSTVFVTSLVVALGTTTAITGLAFFVGRLLAEFASVLFPITVFAATPAAVVAGIFVFAKLYLTFDPVVREQIASTPDAQPLNQMSGTKYRHRPG
jgi:hypothetical protein